jgi:hypothetical protein
MRYLGYYKTQIHSSNRDLLYQEEKTSVNNLVPPDIICEILPITRVGASPYPGNCGFSTPWAGILNDELAVAHNDQTINLDSAFAGNDIDVNFRTPIRSSKFRVRIAEGHVQSWHLFVLQKVAA